VLSVPPVPVTPPVDTSPPVPEPVVVFPPVPVWAGSLEAQSREAVNRRPIQSIGNDRWRGFTLDQ
jgi:hypothetical protein